MSNDPIASAGDRAVRHNAGGTIYYRTEGSSPPPGLIGGGPSNAGARDSL